MANQDFRALLSSAHQRGFSATGQTDRQTLNQCRELIRQSLHTGASLSTTKKQLQILFSHGAKDRFETTVNDALKGE